MRTLGALGFLAVVGVSACDGGSGRTGVNDVHSAKPAKAGDEVDAHDDHGNTLHFRIDGVEKDVTDPDGDVSFYALSVRDESGSFGPYCAADVEGKSRAIPVKGSWNESATYVPDSENKTTFACTSGAIGKCIRFGYKPWKSVGGQSLLAHHQACVRMVRADYCGDGRPHTKDGTAIDVWDREGIERRDPAKPDHPEVFEAAWGPDGAEYLAVPRWSDDVAAIVAECPEKLRGRNGAETKLDAAEAERRYPKALVFDGRFVNESDRWFASTSTPSSPDHRGH